MTSRDRGSGGARNPDGPTKLTKPAWKYLLKRSVKEGLSDELPDKAAALTFYAVLSLFPALIALISILGVFGRGEETTNKLLELLGEYAPADTVEMLRGPISSITETQSPGLGLAFGLLTALWTASRYVDAFSRAMNGIYAVGEGRPVWKRRPLMYLLTALLIVLVAAAALMLVLTGPIAKAVGDLAGLGDTAVTVWGYAKFPALLVVAVVIIALLYYFTPNVRRPKFRWVSIGAVVALAAAVVATAGFVLYLRFMGSGSLNQTYGSLAGVILFFFWLWSMNLMLLFGAELDVEMERARELQRGLPAARAVQLPLRDGTQIAKYERSQEALEAEAEDLRRE